MSTALIAGVAGGVGRALLARLRQQRVRCATVSRDAAPLAVLGADATVVADVPTCDGAAAAVAACCERLGVPDRLISCAGSFLPAPAHRTSEAQWRATQAANLDSAFSF